MRTRTDGDYAHREDAIESAADFYDCNKTKAVVSAYEDVPRLAAAARQILERDDYTLEQRQEIADTLSTRAVRFEVETTISAITKGTMDQWWLAATGLNR